MLTRPITNYMDHLSLLETVRIRTRLRIQNILPQTSKCTMSLEEFGQNATRVLTGEAGMDVLHEYFNILQLPGDLAWSSFFGLNQDECLPITVMGMADSWRRLVLPFQGMPWALFRLIHMDFDQGVEFLRDTGLRTGGCAKCQDPFFGQVSCCQVACHTFFLFCTLSYVKLLYFTVNYTQITQHNIMLFNCLPNNKTATSHSIICLKFCDSGNVRNHVELSCFDVWTLAQGYV